MRVVVNQMSALGQKTGIGHYTSELLRCLRAQAGEDRIDAFPDGWPADLLRRCARLRPSGEPCRAAQGGTAPRPSLRGRALGWLRRAGRACLARGFRRACGREHYHLYHEPNFIPLPSDRVTVATLHDLSVLLHPHWHPADRVAHHERHFRVGLASCQHFLAISEFGRQEIIRTLHIRPERVTRTYMGIRPGLGVLPRALVALTLARLGLPARYLLYLGTIEPRKNLLTLLRAYCALPAKLRERWPLLLVGRWGWNTADVADYYHREARHRGVRQLGYLADEHLAAVYNGARALVFPSIYEGFGLPPLEMMACGGAVLASTAGALVETVGSRAHLIPPEHQDGWRAAMNRVLVDDDWWQSLRRGVTEVAKTYTWDRCAAETLRVYRMLCGVEADRPPRRRAG
jgi:alpha-1,3-rhamnosyl/mannosyltransferase